MQINLDAITEILSIRGKEQYGAEAVSQLEHALQCASLAEKNSANPELYQFLKRKLQIRDNSFSRIFQELWQESIT